MSQIAIDSANGCGWKAGEGQGTCCHDALLGFLDTKTEDMDMICRSTMV